MTSHSSTNDVIDTFNQFLTNVPTNKSFDMTYKIYIRDVADVDDRGMLSTRNSSINLQEEQPVTIASHGTVLSTATSSTESLSNIDQYSDDIMLRKERSMVNLPEMNRKFGYPEPEHAYVPTPETVYENLSILSSKSSSGTSVSRTPSEINETENLAGCEEKVGESIHYIKISDCFDQHVYTK